MPQCLNGPMPQWSNASMPQWSNASMVQCLNASMPQCLNASMVQCLNASMPQCLNASMVQCLNASMRTAKHGLQSNSVALITSECDWPLMAYSCTPCGQSLLRLQANTCSVAGLHRAGPVRHRAREPAGGAHHQRQPRAGGEDQDRAGRHLLVRTTVQAAGAEPMLFFQSSHAFLSCIPSRIPLMHFLCIRCEACCFPFLSCIPYAETCICAHLLHGLLVRTLMRAHAAKAD